MIIYLIRHGQTTSDIENRYGGNYDDHLTHKGKEQAVELSEKIRDKGVEIFYYSPLLRAKETVDIVVSKLNCTKKEVNDFRECNRFGVITGLTKEEAQKSFPEQVVLLSDYKTQLEGGESYEHFKERIINEFDKLTKNNYKTIAIFTHSGPIRCILREYFGIELNRSMEDCEMVTLKKDGGDLHIVSLKM